MFSLCLHFQLSLALVQTGPSNVISDKNSLATLHQVWSREKAAAEMPVSTQARHLGHPQQQRAVAAPTNSPCTPGEPSGSAEPTLTAWLLPEPKSLGMSVPCCDCRGILSASKARTGREMRSVAETIQSPVQIAYCNDQIFQAITWGKEKQSMQTPIQKSLWAWHEPVALYRNQHSGFSFLCWISVWQCLPGDLRSRAKVQGPHWLQHFNAAHVLGKTKRQREMMTMFISAKQARGKVTEESKCDFSPLNICRIRV